MMGKFRALNPWCQAVFFGAIVGVAAQAAADPPAAASVQAAPAIDEAALAILKKVETTMLGLKSYQAECWTTTVIDGSNRPASYDMATLTALKPSFMRYDWWQMKADANGAWSKIDEAPFGVTVSNGETVSYKTGSGFRVKHDFGPSQMNQLYTGNNEPWNGFFDPLMSPYAFADYLHRDPHGLLEARDAGADIVEGTPVEKIFLRYKLTYAGPEQESKETWYISADGLVRRRVKWQRETAAGKIGSTTDAILRSVKTNVEMPVDSPLFTYKTPVDAKAQEGTIRPQLPPPAKGTAAPDFTAVDASGKRIKLSSLRGKVVVIDFWASWCGPCKASMPHNQEVAKKLKAAGLPVVVLAVDNSEDKRAFTLWTATHPEFDAIHFAYVDPKVNDLCGAAYGLEGIPTQFVVDAKGIIRSSFVGFGGPNNDLENAIRSAIKNK